MSIFTDILQIKKPEKDLLESLLSAYESAAKARGFEVQKEGRTLTLKGERISAILCIEFGGRTDFFDTITYMGSAPAEYKILIVSSNARSLPMEAAYTVLKKKLMVKEKWMLLDIEGRKPPMYINWSGTQQAPGAENRERETGNRSGPPRYESRRGKERGRPRRKMIYGAPHERKEQD
ncbi:MAG: hypothetical protein PHQ80_00925 [Candidatus ainarchaeum sp.]|nr:hypothetical protein [Candidatus ainarchaeum sp.]MDD5096080.1 hypothetical protein [Candidatus ainarchaeum sp.]